MASTPSNNRSRRLLIALVIVVLLAAGAGLGFTLGMPQVRPRANQPQPVGDAGHEPVRNAPPTPANNAAELPKVIDPQPVPDKQPVEVNLPALTRFRRLVLEGDTTLELADPQSLTAKAAERVAVLDATLSALGSRFAVYSAPLVAGTLSTDEWRQLQTESAERFLKPDVASAAYAQQRSPRVAIWLRQGATLPAGEANAPPGVSIPLGRRLQEGVSADVAQGWLEAMESEYGKTDFGVGPSDLPFDIVVFGSAAEYQDFSRRRLNLSVPDWSAGFFSNAWDVACAPVLETTSMAEVLRHEMFHALQAHLAPQSLMVPWFGEGSAEWLDKAPPQGNRLRTHKDFATAAYGYLATLIDQGYELNLREFLALDVAGFYARPELHYLLAYCFVDFLRAEDDLREVYFQYWKLMVDGASPDSAFSRSFGLLDMDELQRRFVAKLRSVPRQGRAPRFTHDGAAEFFDAMPARLEGSKTTAGSGKISDAWFEVLGKLQAAGFDVAGSGYFKGEYDVIIVAIDHTESMENRLDPNTFDFEAFGRWLFSMRYAGTLSLKRTTPGTENEEEVPPAVLMALVEAVITDKVDAFTAATGITVGNEVQKDIRKNWDQSDLHGKYLETYKKRDLARVTAESVAWYWGTRQDKANVTVVDFHTDEQSQTEKSAFVAKGQRSIASPIATLFSSLARSHKLPAGMGGADTDWWTALQAIVSKANDASAGRVACMLFTDGPNSAGFYGHLEAGRKDELYVRDQKNMAQAFAELWSSAGLGNAQQPSGIQIFALPGAENQSLEEIPALCPQARLDTWLPRFKKP